MCFVRSTIKWVAEIFVPCPGLIKKIYNFFNIMTLGTVFVFLLNFDVDIFNNFNEFEGENCLKYTMPKF